METATESYPLHLIALLPIAGALVNLLVGRRLGKTFAGLVGCAAVLGAWMYGWEAASILREGGEALVLRGRFFDGDWIHASELVASRAVHIAPGLAFDRLSSVMVLVITTVGLLIHVYSTAYMEDDEGFARYFAYLNLFTGSMLILVLGDSLVVTFVGWEGVGLCSYLLIGFWYTKEANAYAGRKAFIVNRVGDFGFLLGMFLLFTAAQTLSYEELAKPASLAALKAPLLTTLFPRGTYATFAALLLFLGATGKSAQIPLYVWLPDAMAGPTPVSALIHAATMVTAGVYMVARLHGVFEIDPFVSALIASVGALTALFAATMGITQRPIKKILAYSTISQLGFMFIGVGTRSYGAGVFHLVTHAFFKAGLFLGAGSIMHALHGEEDVVAMGGLAKKLPITRWTFLVYCLAIAGIFPFAGFFSKDAILAGAFVFDQAKMPGWPHWLGHAIYGVGLVAAACTAFYMFRAYFLVFHGAFRGDPHRYDHAHESPPAMAIPLVVLAVGAALLGFLGVPKLGEHFAHGNLFAEWLGPELGREHEAEGVVAQYALMGAATFVALLGIGLAWALYGRGPSPAAERAKSGLGPAYRLVANKYYVDELYDRAVVRPLRFVARWFCFEIVDKLVIDLVLVRGAAVVVDVFGRALRYTQSGDAQRYVVGVVLGLAAMLFAARTFPACSGSRFEVTAQGDDVTVRAAGIAEPEPARALLFTFDFGDGTPPVKQPRPVATHHYAGGGKKEIVVSVEDPRWGTTATKRHTVVLP